MKNLLIGILFLAVIVLAILLVKQRRPLHERTERAALRTEQSELVKEAPTRQPSPVSPTNQQTASSQAAVVTNALLVKEAFARPIIPVPQTTQATAQVRAVVATNAPVAPATERLKSWKLTKQNLPPETHQTILEEIKRAVAHEAPELNVLEIIRDAKVSDTRLLNKHSGVVSKFCGIVLEQTDFDLTLVINETEIVCSFGDSSWKQRTNAPGTAIHICGQFESFFQEDRSNVFGAIQKFRQITMSDCYLIENFYKLRTTPRTEEENRLVLREFQADMLYMLNRDLTRRKNSK